MLVRAASGDGFRNQPAASSAGGSNLLVVKRLPKVVARCKYRSSEARGSPPDVDGSGLNTVTA
jgi:hypothetical protein